MKLPILTLSLILATLLTFGQGAVFNWAQNYTTPIDKIELDSLSNIYSLGGGSITKRTSSGSLLWTRTITQIQSMAVSPNGDVYIAGGFTGTVNFNSWGIGYLMTSAGNTDIFVSKLNTNGDFVWAQRIGDVGEDVASQISLDTLGHVYITGKYTGNVDFDPGPTNEIFSNGNSLAIKLDTSGNYVWGKSWNWNTSSGPGFLSSGADGLGNLILIKQISGTNDIDPGIGVTNVITFSDYVIFQLNPQGNLNWFFTIEPINPFSVNLVLFEVAPSGVFSISGLIRGSYDFNGWVGSTFTSSTELYVVKYSSNGNAIMGKQIPSLAGASGYIYPTGIDIDQQNDIYLNGIYQNAISVNGIVYGSPVSSLDPGAFCCKILPNAQIPWFRIYGFHYDLNPGNYGVFNSSIACSNDGCIYNAGTFISPYNGINFNFMNSSTPQVNLSSSQGEFFIQKICQTNCQPTTTSASLSSMCSAIINGLEIYNSSQVLAYYVNAQGCDSIVNTNLQITNYFKYDTIIGCDNVIFNSTLYTNSTLITQNVTGFPWSSCDTTKYTNIIILPKLYDTISVSACNNYIINGTTLYSSGVYTDTLVSSSGCDSILTTVLTINHTQYDTININACGSYLFNGITHYSGGLFTDTLVSSFGCDSILTINLTVGQANISSLVNTACGSYTLNGITYTTSGLKLQHFTNSMGCDSTVYLYLTINQPSTPTVINATACWNYTLNGVTYNVSGTYTQQFTNSVGCDSTVTLNLTVNYPTSSSLVKSACGSYTLNGITYTTSGLKIQTFTSSNGCDSSVYLYLTITQPSTPTVINATACWNYTLNGVTYNVSGTYTQQFTNSVGCDSTVTLNLTVNYPTSSSLVKSACGSYTLNGITYTTSGLKIQTFTSSNGCDSSVYLYLTITQPSTPTVINATACWNYTLNGVTYNVSGTYTQQFTNSVGCDSTVTLNLTVNYPTSSSLVKSACGSYTLNGITYTTSGLKIQTFTSSNGCDSSVYLYLTITQPSTPTVINATACWNYTLNGVTYNVSGTYTQQFTNSVGCDSTVTLNLTVNYPTSSSLVKSACGSYTLNGITYTTSGLKIQTFTSSNGCDSSVYLYLTITQPSTPTVINATACWNYTLNGVTYNVSGTYTQQFTNSVGCDSTVTLNLTINYPTSSSIVQSSVGQYILNGITYTSSGLYTQTFVGSNGCDSVVYLYLTINPLNEIMHVRNSINMPNDIILYPNPTTNTVTVQSSINIQDATLHIYDMTGAMMLEQVNLNGSKFQLNLSTYAAGIYQLEIINQGERYRTKVIKE